jgi:hypothetical protein
MDEHHLRRIRIRRGTNSQRKEVLFEEGEFVYVNDIKRLYVGDGKKTGGLKVQNCNHVADSAIRPKNSDIGDLLYNKLNKATYIVDKDEKLKLIITSSDDIYKYINLLNYIENLLLKLEKLCCNTEFALDTDDGINILVDYGDWIRVKDAVFVDNQCKPPIISEKKLNLITNKTYTLNILDYKSSPDIVFTNNLIDRDENNPPKTIKIIQDTVNTSKDIKVTKITDNTITFSASIPDSRKLVSTGTYIDYSIENECGVKQIQKASVTGSVRNNDISYRTTLTERYSSYRSVSKYTKYRMIENDTQNDPWDKDCWGLLYFDSFGAPDAWYITQVAKEPIINNGISTLEKTSYGPIGPVPTDDKKYPRNYGLFLFYKNLNFDLSVWGAGSGSSGWSIHFMKDYKDKTKPPTQAQIATFLKSLPPIILQLIDAQIADSGAPDPYRKTVAAGKTVNSIYTSTAIPDFLSD